jgi:hypothetical protein
MTQHLDWIVASAVSGCVWGTLAVVLTESSDAWPGVIASPLIGLMLGFAIRPFRDGDWGGRMLISLVGLYFAVGLFGVFTGAARGLSAGWTLLAPGMINDVVLLWASLTLGGLVVLLWPLSLVNHLAIWSLQRRADSRGVRAS